jgi:hypothetical protein
MSENKEKVFGGQNILILNLIIASAHPLELIQGGKEGRNKHSEGLGGDCFYMYSLSSFINFFCFSFSSLILLCHHLRLVILGFIQQIMPIAHILPKDITIDQTTDQSCA